MGETYRRTNITATLPWSGLDGKVTKLKLLLSKDTWNLDWNLQKYTQITIRLWKKRFSGLMNLNSLFMSEGNQGPLITCIIPSQRWSMVVAASCSGGVYQWQGLGKWSEKTESWMQLNTEISLMKAWFRAVRTSDWLKVHLPTWQSPCTQPRQCRERQRDDSINVLEWPSQSWDLEPISLKQFDKTQQNKMWKTWRGMQTFCRHCTCSHTFF